MATTWAAPVAGTGDLEPVGPELIVVMVEAGLASSSATYQYPTLY